MRKSFPSPAKTLSTIRLFFSPVGVPEPISSEKSSRDDLLPPGKVIAGALSEAGICMNRSTAARHIADSRSLHVNGQ